MADQSRSAHLQILFESALQSYQKKTGITLLDHPLVVQIQSCDTVESITTIMQDQTHAFSHLPECDRIIKPIKTTVSILTRLSSAASLTDAFGTIFSPAKAILAGLAILLATAHGVISNCDALVDLLETIESFVNRLDIYTQISPTPAIDEIVIKIFVELLSTLAQVTEKLKQRRLFKPVKNLLEKNGIEAVLQRLERLTQDEARTTAAQTFHVLHGLVQNMSVVIDDGEASIDGVRKALEMLHQIVNDMNKSKRDQLQVDIHKWLSPPDPWKNYNVALKSRQRETGAWFINGNTLSEWKTAGRSSLLWIHGKPGAGKSVLCSSIIEDIETMQKSGLASLAMFYYDFREDEKKDLRGLLSSVLFQLCDQSDSYYDILSTFYSTHRRGAKCPSDDELIRCLKHLLNLPGQAPVYLIVDALDECSNASGLSSPRAEVLMLLEDLIDSHLPDLRICVTSRPEADIKPILDPLTFRSVSLHDESGQKEDIKGYIRWAVSTNRNMRRWKPEHKQLVIDILTERADGMFRWVYCQLDYLSKCLPGRIRHALEELPETLDGTYERTLQEINDGNWEFARRLLLCVAVVARPLRVEELAEFLAFDFDASPIPKFREDWRLDDPLEAVLSTCSTLLSLVNVDDAPVIQFSHFSVKEFLTSSRFAEKSDAISHRYHISMTLAHTLVTQACLGILLHLAKNTTRDGLRKFPLAEYAAGHWFEHARFEGVSENADEGMIQLFNERKHHLAIWLWIHDPTVPSWGRYIRDEGPSPPRGTPLHYAAFCGLRGVVKLLIVEPLQDVDCQSFTNKATPLLLASERGHVEVVRILVKHGANAAAQDNHGWTPLHQASKGGHFDLARFLVEHGGDPAARDNDGLTPLHRASEGGHLDLARILVEHGADPAAQDDDGWTPLHWASEDGRRDLARILVERGADLAAQDNHGWTPLRRAFERGNLNVARFLLDHGADPAAQDNDGWTPLQGATEGRDLDLARILVERGVDLAAQDNDGWTPLHRASKGGHLNFVRFIIEHGVDLAARDNDGWTPLRHAFEGGHPDVVRILVEHGADLAAQDNDRWPLLHWAFRRDHLDLARILVERGADLAARDGNGWTPLHWASYLNHLDFVGILIEHGADLAARDNDGWTPLGRASEGDHPDVVQILVEHGADLVARDSNRWTLLHWASRRGHVGLVGILIKHGADPEAQDNKGQTPLHWASCRNHLDLVGILIKHGADPAAQNKYGETPLHYASKFGLLNLARFLIEHGADPEAQDNKGRTPLHLASKGGHLDLVQTLIEHGADLAARDSDGWTPLHWAYGRGRLDLVGILIKHGADPAAQDKYGKTPQSYTVPH